MPIKMMAGMHLVSQKKKSHVEFSWFQTKRKPKQCYWKAENKQERVLCGKRNNRSFQVLKLTTMLALPFWGFLLSDLSGNPSILAVQKTPKYHQSIRIKGENMKASNGFTAEVSKAKESKELWQFQPH